MSLLTDFNMMSFVLLFILAASFILLIILIIIDFRVRLLPNKYVFPFAALGLVFHALQDFEVLSLQSCLVGGALGYGLLWAVRYFGSKYYGQEALGLGDVKLMGATGLWLGPENLTLALTIGASLSIVHGVIYALITKKSLRRLEIPAGPGLIGGIMIMIGWMLYERSFIFFAEEAFLVVG